MASLEITDRESKRTIALDRPTCRIGRDKKSDVVIDEPAASRNHCVIERSGDVFVLKDLGSRNGTWVGTERVSECRLEPGSIFRIGNWFFRLVEETDDDVAVDVVTVPPLGTRPPDRSRPATERPRDRESEPTPAPAAMPTSVDDRAGEWRLPEGSVGGPLARQLEPLLSAGTIGKHAPAAARDVRLLDRHGKRLKTIDDSEHRAGAGMQALQTLIFAALRARATDIHIEPKTAGYAIRVRIDGLLHPLPDLAQPLAVAMLNVVKVLCEIDISRRGIVQEGSFVADLPDRRISFRASYTPVLTGQKLALRLLDTASVPNSFEELGMDADLADEIRRLCNQDAGMIIVSGPTGSGKTTTLYTALKCVDVNRRNLVTIEDPIEYRLDRATQISIDPVHDVTFASVMRTLVRQDPNVLLVGEIRDRETAELAMQAAGTGHLVLTTVHARDTIGTVFRLLDLGVEPTQIANSVSLAISQRLVRVLCSHCKRSYRPDARLVRELRIDERQSGTLFAPVGCTHCLQTGYTGRLAVFEVLRFTPQLRDVVLTRPTVGELRRAAGDWLFRTLTDSVRRKLLVGLTSIEEVDRVANAD